MKTNADELILSALKEDITSEDISTNSVMREYTLGEVELICKQDGVIAGLEVFKRTFELLDECVEVKFNCKDGDTVSKGEKIGLVRGDIRVLLSGERTALNYLQSDLDDGWDKGQRHSGDLTPRDFTVVSIDKQQFGVGCVNSWGAWPRWEYQMPYGDYEYTFVIRSVK